VLAISPEETVLETDPMLDPEEDDDAELADDPDEELVIAPLQLW